MAASKTKDDVETTGTEGRRFLQFSVVSLAAEHLVMGHLLACSPS